MPFIGPHIAARTRSRRSDPMRFDRTSYSPLEDVHRIGSRPSAVLDAEGRAALIGRIGCDPLTDPYRLDEGRIIGRRWTDFSSIPNETKWLDTTGRPA